MGRHVAQGHSAGGAVMGLRPESPDAQAERRLPFGGDGHGKQQY